MIYMEHFSVMRYTGKNIPSRECSVDGCGIILKKQTNETEDLALHTTAVLTVNKNQNEKSALRLVIEESEWETDNYVFAQDVHDIAYVYINKKFAGKFDRTVPLTKKQIKQGVKANESFNFPIPAFNGRVEIDILVEGMGHVNFNKEI